MVERLAVLTPAVGLPSETFVQRHANLLAPGDTLTVTTRCAPELTSTWAVDGDLVVLEGVRPAPAVSRRAKRLAARVAGRPPGQWRWEPSADDLVRLGSAFDDFGVTVVLTEYLDTWLPLLTWLRRRGVRVFAHSHGRDVSVRLRDPWWQERYGAYDHADGVVSVSEHVRARLERLGLDRSRLHVIPCGVDVPTEPPTRNGAGDVRIMAVGRFVAKKHPLATIEAFARAAHADDRLRLTMVGDGPLAAEVESAIRHWEVAGRVTLLGPQPHDTVLGLLRRADVFVQHSVVSPHDGDEEGLPVAVLEAMAAAAPVVATRHTGIPEAVVEGVTGLLVDEGDVSGMAEAIIELAADEKRRRAFGAAGHRRAKERFSWTRERAELRRLLGLEVAPE